MGADLDLSTRRDELVRLGFTIVDEDDGSLTATRVARAGTLPALCWTAIIRVRRIAHLDKRTLIDDRASLHRAVSDLDPPEAPWHSRTGRALLHVYLTDTVDQDARTLSSIPPMKCLAGHPQAAILDGNGGQTEGFGIGLYMPQVTWLMRRCLDPTAPDPGEPGTAITSVGWLLRGNKVLLVGVLVAALGLVALLAVASSVLLLLLIAGVSALAILAG